MSKGVCRLLKNPKRQVLFDEDQSRKFPKSGLFILHFPHSFHYATPASNTSNIQWPQKDCCFALHPCQMPHDDVAALIFEPGIMVIGLVGKNRFIRPCFWTSGRI
ncbi:hypothetical protein V6N11_026854 [Hibiscus sabdariffa]|uniref:Uncharacterized protein n=1 Tax=Hibiscus sabdariffa TaxID=183260 RepID=A0ABR2SXS2_9ROSI